MGAFDDLIPAATSAVAEPPANPFADLVPKAAEAVSPFADLIPKAMQSRPLEGADLKAAQDQAVKGLLETQRILSMTPGGLLAQAELGKAAETREMQDQSTTGILETQRILGTTPGGFIAQAALGKQAELRDKQEEADTMEMYRTLHGMAAQATPPNVYGPMAETMAGPKTTGGLFTPVIQPLTAVADKIPAEVYGGAGIPGLEALNAVVGTGDYMKGFAESAAGGAESMFMSPGGAALTLAGANIPKAAHGIMGLLFGAQGIRQFPEQWKQLQAETDPAKRRQLYGKLVGDTAMIALGAKGAKDVWTGLKSEMPNVPDEHLAAAVAEAPDHPIGKLAATELQARGLEQSGAPATAAAVREVAPVVNEVRPTGELQSTVELPPKAEPVDTSQIKGFDAYSNGLQLIDTSKPERTVGMITQAATGEVGIGSHHGAAAEEGLGRPIEATDKRLRLTSHGRILPMKGEFTPEEPETATMTDAPPIREVPLNEITLSKDVPQFKKGADERGVVEPLGGKYTRRGTPPIAVWERLDGTKEIVTGRHKFALAQDTGETTIPAQVYREADGFTAHDAAMLDAETNIRDGQGTVSDYASYFKNAEIDEATAKSRGLLERGKGKAGFSIAKNGSDDTFALHQSGRLADSQASAIAEAAPGNAGAQQVGIKAALEGKSAEYVGNLIKAALSRAEPSAKTGDLFAFDDAAMREMEAQAKTASQIQSELRKTKSAISGASKDPARAKAEGVDIQNPEQVKARLGEINVELARWDNWPMHADLVARTRGEVVAEPKAPKLLPGEKQGDLIASTQAEPLALVGEKGTDWQAHDRERVAAEAAQAEAKAREAREQPGLSMGPGAARAEEIPEAKTVSIKNAKVDEERAARGELPMMQPARKAMGKTWDEGMQRIEGNQDEGKELVDAIRDGRKKDVSAVDHAVLLHEKIRIMNERDMEAERILDPNTADTDRVESRARWAALEDRVNEVDQATQAAGTISGRALQFRQALARDDYTFAGMERKARAAKGGVPLTPEESTRIKAQADRIAELEKRVEELQTNRTEKEGTQAADESVKKLRIEASKGGKRKATDIASTQDRLVNGLKKRAAEGDTPTKVGNFIQQLALNFVRSGIKEREPLIDAVHGVLKDIFPDIERSQTRDAISGYGDFKELDKEPAKIRLRQLKGEMQQIGKIEDMMVRNERPRKTGIERREPSDEERRLIREVNELKKKGGYTVTDPARQLKSALDSVKTRLQNQIRDLDHSIVTREPIVSQRKGLAYDAEAEQLRQRRDALKEQYEGIFGKKEMTDEQRLKMATSAAMRSEQAWIDRLDNAQKGVFDTGAKGRTVTSPEIESIKSHIEAIKAEVKELHDIANPAKTPEEIALQSYKTRTANRIAALQDKLAREDFSKTPRRELKMDADALRLKEQAERLKLDFDRGVAQERLKNRTLTEKASDTFAKWRRGFLLSSPITLAKLTSAAIQRMTITPIEEFVGAGYGKLPIFSDIASKAPREGGLNAKAEAKAFTQGFTKGMKDAWDVLRTGKSELDVLYGKRDVMPREAIDFIGLIHGALKTVTKRNEFARSLEKRATQAIAEGVDVSDPLVQSRLALDAYKDANRSIFMQDNRVVAAYKRAVGALEQPEKSTGRPTLAGKTGATVAKVLLPIVKVPTNIVAETFQYALGSVTGLGRTGRAMVKGIDTLRPEEADLIMRDLKKGSIGAAVLLLGYFNADKIGGYYQPGQKRKEGDVKFGSVRIFGHDVPSFLVHNPLLEVLQLGATVRRVADSKLRKKDTETQGLSSGLIAGGLGLAEEVPFVREMAEVSKAFDPHSRGAFIGEMAKSIAIPQALQWTAAQMDKRKGETIRRKPEGVIQHIETGIPGLREKVPEKEEKGALKPLRPLTPRPLVPSRIRP